MKFYSSFDRPASVAEPKCPKEIPDYILDSETGTLVNCGTIPFYERIQSYHESTKLTTKLKRFASGDSTALGSGIVSNSDFSGVPTDLREVLDSRKKISQDFSTLPGDIRELFKNDLAIFEQAVLDGTAERRIYEHVTSQSGNGAAGASGTAAGGQNPPAGE